MCQGLSSLVPGGSKMRDPGNRVGTEAITTFVVTNEDIKAILQNS